MRYQIVTLRVPFEERAVDGPPEDPPSEWAWSGIVDRAGTVVLDCDPVSEDPDVQPIERVPGYPLAHLGASDDLAVVLREAPAGVRNLVATFSAQAWVNDYAIECDAEGDTTWDCTREVWVGMGDEQRADLLATLDDEDQDGEWLDRDDWLRGDPDAPEWVRNWHGPFDIHVRYGL